jgi:acetoin utilization protein AcuC
VVLGGGGYNPWTVTRYWAGLWGRLSGRRIPAALPEAARAILARLQSDLIDDEDIRETWLTTLADEPNDAPARDEIRRLRARLAQTR